MNEPLRVYIERLEPRLIPEPMSGCLLWTGSESNGYGDVRIDWKKHYVHRLMYELFNGPIPVGLHVLHKCDVRLCSNPDHLFLGSNVDNIHDSMRKGRRKGITRRRPSGLIYKRRVVQ